MICKKIKKKKKYRNKNVDNNTIICYNKYKIKESEER